MKGYANAHLVLSARELASLLERAPGPLVLDRGDAVILDRRSDAEYEGRLVRARRRGAVPGAVHIAWTRNLPDSGEFKSAAELQRMYTDAGVTPDREVITYCQGGYRAANS